MPARLFGRLPGHVPDSLHDLTWYVAGTLPKPPAAVAVPEVPAQSDGTAWGMDGNDNYGDCGVAAINHGFMADATATGTYGSELFPSDSNIVDYYLTYTGGQDTGVVLADFLAYVKTNGYLNGHTLQAFAPVAVHDVTTLQYTVASYDFAYTGITVTEAMMTANQAGKPWTTVDTDGEVIGGHCIPIIGYDDKNLYAVTWGGVQAITYPAWHRMSEEAWALITGEFTAGDGRGVNLAALQADLTKLKR
jgi:hypothetical protein